MFEVPTQQQIDDIMRRAHVERARTMRQGMIWIGRKLSLPFRVVLNRPSEHRS